jgi:SAM-dependent methyltransferase
MKCTALSAAGNPVHFMHPTLVCPFCRIPLERHDFHARCSQCDRGFESLRGILDLRTADDEYLPNSQDWQVARLLDAQFDALDFRGLLELYYDLIGDLPKALRLRQIDHILSAPARAQQWMQALGTRVDRGVILDLGCGPGGFLASQPRGHCDWIGLDIAMRWLLLARKRLNEMGREDVTLVCGCAEALPFADDAIAAIVAGDVVEHVRSREILLKETHRVLSANGRMIAATPNRFSLAPEPHVNVWGVGFLPRRLMKPYVKMRSGVDFRAIVTHGWRGWTRLAKGSPFGGCQIVAPEVALGEHSSSLKKMMVGVYNPFVRSKCGQILAKVCGPLLHLTFVKAPQPSPTTRPSSRP